MCMEAQEWNGDWKNDPDRQIWYFLDRDDKSVRHWQDKENNFQSFN